MMKVQKSPLFRSIVEIDSTICIDSQIQSVVVERLEHQENRDSLPEAEYSKNSTTMNQIKILEEPHLKSRKNA